MMNKLSLVLKQNRFYVIAKVSSFLEHTSKQWKYIMLISNRDSYQNKVKEQLIKSLNKEYIYIYIYIYI